MKLLFENWRKFITESAEHFGSDFEEFKKRTEQGEHPVKVAEETLNRIGKGSSRLVYELSDNPHAVLKVINVDIVGDEEFYDPDYVNPITKLNRHHKINSNEWEANLDMQQRYPGVFPKSYEHAEDFSWILVERVETIDKSQMFEALNISDEQELFEKVMKKQYGKADLSDEGVTWFKIIDDAIQTVKKGQLSDDQFIKGWKPVYGDYDELSEDTAKLVMPKRKRSFNFRTQAGEEFEASRRPSEIVSKILSTPQNRRIFLAMAELGIPHYDFLHKNLGISHAEEPHLVLLDATLFGKSKERGEL